MSTEAETFSRRVWWAVRPLWYWRLLRLFLRSFWLSVAIGVAGWQLSLANEWPLSLVVWGAVAYAAFMVIFPASLLWPIPVSLLARRLDAYFSLRDRLTTANEIAARAARNYLEQRLLGSADRLLGTVRGRLVRENHMPWTDFALTVVAMALLLAVYLNAITLDAPPSLTASGAQPPNLPALATEPAVTLPGSAPEDELGEPQSDGQPGDNPPEGGDPQTVQGEPVEPEEAQAALDALIEALGSQPITESAAADLARGDTESAAARLRQLADQAGELDPETRQRLAESLNRAAESMEATTPGVSDQISEAAQAIAPDNGDPAESAAEAAQGLEDLANLLEALDQSRTNNSASPEGAGGSGAGDNQGQDVNRETQTNTSTERLQSEGQPVELPADQAPNDQNGILQPPEHDSLPADTTNTPYSQTGASGSGGDQPSDPLSFPWRLRRVIQRYFSPR